MIEDEIVHWWKDEKGEQHKTVLKVESEDVKEVNGYPRDGIVFVRVSNSTGYAAIKLSPAEALQVSTQLLQVAKELLNKKRDLWHKMED
ncbi:hypothetical protein HYT84_01635 [Candidatus Micrarchaeota archaeon]|nr:hypothetical protein [Candidatus Micrarchaeota archaeon]